MKIGNDNREGSRGKRSRSATVSDPLVLCFGLRRIREERPTDDERAAIAEGRQAYSRGGVVTLGEWRQAMAENSSWR